MWLRYIQLFLSWSMQWIWSLPSFFPPLPSPSICLSHHCLDRWSASTACAAFHLSTSSLLPAISSTHTHDRFSQCFHLSKSVHRIYIYFRRATASTSNSSDSSSCAVLGILIAPVPCTPSYWVKNIFSRLPTIQPASSVPSGSTSRLVSRRWAIWVTQ